MKKFTKIIIAMILIAVITVTAVACVKKDADGLIILKTPKISFSGGNTIEWKPIKNAEKYGVSIDDGNGFAEDIIIKDSSYTITVNAKVSIKVRAIGDGKTLSEGGKYTFSEYSKVLEYDPIINLKSPDGVALIKQDDGSIKVSWNAVTNASSYSVAMTLNDKSTGDPVSASGTETVFAADKFTEAGDYMFKVKAMGDGEKILNSPLSVSVSYRVEKDLADPTKVLFSTKVAGEDAKITFKEVDHAEIYYVRAWNDINGDGNYDVGEFQEQSINATTSDTATFKFKEFTFTEVGKYTFEVQAARKAGVHSYYKPSKWIKVNLESDEAKACEMQLYPSPTNLALDSNGVLSWDQVPGAPKYTLEIKSNSNTFTDGSVEKPSDDGRVTVDLSKNDTIIQDTSAGGMVVFFNVYVPENLNEGILKGLVSEDKIDLSYQSSAKPEKVDGYYEVKNLLHLAYMAKEPNEKYRLFNNIDAKGAYFYGVDGDFSGEFDGNGKTLRNFNLIPTKDSNSVSMFGTMTATAIVKDLLIVESKIDIKNFTYLDNKNVNAAFISIENNGLIDNVTISSAISTSSSATPSIATEGAFGGIALVNKKMISNCATSFIASAYGAIGGITANNEGELFNVRVYGSILKANALMSVTPIAPTPVLNTASSPDVSKIAYAGGIAAVNTGKISYSVMQENATVTATASGVGYKAYAGGMVGYMSDGEITYSYVSRISDSGSSNAVSAINSTATETGNASFAGGFIGVLFKGKIDHCYNHFVGAKATGTIGGFAGKVEIGGTISNGYTLTSHNISGNVKGGAVGVNEGTFANFYYGEYETNKNDDIKTSAEGAVVGITDVTKGEDMSTLKIEGFVKNDNVLKDRMILAGVVYFHKEFGFRPGTTKKDEERTNISKAYIGSRVIELPTVPMGVTETGFGTDKYVVVEGGKTFIINRVIQVI